MSTLRNTNSLSTTTALADIFAAQKELNTRVGMNSDNIVSDEQLTEWVSKYLGALYNEAEELREHTHFRWWKTYSTPIDRHQVKIEIVDMLHFLVSLALPLMSADEMVELYHLKRNLNHRRQDAGYSESYQKVDANGLEDNDKLKAVVRVHEGECCGQCDCMCTH